MKWARQIVIGTSLVVVCAAAAVPANAAVIQFQATDLTDVNAGEDLWMYEYFVSDVTFGPNQGFSVYFDRALYSNLQDPPPQVSLDWDIIVLQPDPSLPDPGIYDALALVNGASISQAFTVTFDWLGTPGSAPGAQDFTINQFADDGSLSSVVPGRTTPVPEPSTLLLAAPAIALAFRRRAVS